MTALTRWNPFEEMEAVQNRLSSFFDWTPVRKGDSWDSDVWSPLIDVIENEDEYQIRADLPGMSKNDLSVTLENGELVIEGKRPVGEPAEGAEWILRERPFGTFTRRLKMPSDADATHIRAAFKEGVLTVYVAKDEKARPRAIEITSE